MTPISSPHSSDGTSTVSGAHWQRNVPDAIRSHDTLVNPDYTDFFTATASKPTDKSPEEWVHAVFESAPAIVRLVVPFAQRLVLGLRLERGSSPDHPLGWKIADRGDGWVRMEAASWFMTAHIVSQVDEGRGSLATFVRYDRRIAAFVWPPVSILHRWVGLLLMRRAVTAG
jgi:hypothetical protein